MAHWHPNLDLIGVCILLIVQSPVDNMAIVGGSEDVLSSQGVVQTDDEKVFHPPGRGVQRLARCQGPMRGHGVVPPQDQLVGSRDSNYEVAVLGGFKAADVVFVEAAEFLIIGREKQRGTVSRPSAGNAGIALELLALQLRL